MARWPSLFALLMVVSAPAVARDKPLLFPVDAKAAAADVATCARHMSATGLDAEGLEAEGWQRYDVSDLPERPFLAGTPLYSRGDGLVAGYVGAGDLHSGCTIIILPKPTTTQAGIRDEISAALSAKPVLERDAKRGHEVLWAPRGPNDLLILLTPDPRNPAIVDVVLKRRVEDWGAKLPPQPVPLNDPDKPQQPKN
jgi:hypothetical protein